MKNLDQLDDESLIELYQRAVSVSSEARSACTGLNLLTTPQVEVDAAEDYMKECDRSLGLIFKVIEQRALHSSVVDSYLSGGNHA